MRINLGKSYKNGFDIWVTCGKKRQVINATRNENGKAYIECTDKPRNQKVESSFKKKVFLVIFSIIMSLIYRRMSMYISDSMMRIVLVILLWILGYIGVWLYSVNNKNQQLFRYHAVEHMVISYYENHKRAPKNIDDLLEENKISITCGSTLSVVILLLISNIFIVLPILPNNFFFKVMFILLALTIPLGLWIYDRLNFIQKLVVKDPTNEELELGFLTLKTIYKMKEQNNF